MRSFCQSAGLDPEQLLQCRPVSGIAGMRDAGMALRASVSGASNVKCLLVQLTIVEAREGMECKALCVTMTHILYEHLCGTEHSSLGHSCKSALLWLV